MEDRKRKNNSYFSVERSSDSKDFKSIGLVKGFDGINNSYSFKDEAPLNGRNFYRLKQVDIDGMFKYSDVLTVLFTGINSDFNIFPNPASDKLNVSIPLSDKESLVLIYDINGIKISSEKIESSLVSKTININNLARGTYNIVLIQGSKTAGIKFVKD